MISKGISTTSGLLLLLAAATICCTPARHRQTGDDDVADDDAGDDDSSADDDAGPDDDSSAGDDDAGDDDAGDDDAGDDDAGDDDAGDDDAGDDDTLPDDDDVTPDPLPLCMEETLAFVEQAGVLPAQTVIGDLPSQQIYSCETYQLLDVTINAVPTPWLSSGSAPSWTLIASTPVTLCDAAAQATLSLTGCAPYTCGLYSNTFYANTSVLLTMAQSWGPMSAPFVDVTFSAVTHDVQGQLLSNFIVTGCSLGNLNEDLQAQGVDIFTVLINDVNPHWGVAMQQHLAQVERDAEAASYACWEAR